jgi:hypothetical protein
MNKLIAVALACYHVSSQLASIPGLVNNSDLMKFPPFIDKDTMKFNYPEEINQLSAIFRLEVPASESKVFHYEITEATTNCTMNIGFYISVVKEVNQEQPLSIKMKIYDPRGQVVDSIHYKTNGKEQGMANLSLSMIGKYKFVLSNIENPTDMIVDLAFGLTACHSIKHKLHQNDLIMFTNRFQSYVMKQTVA